MGSSTVAQFGLPAVWVFRGGHTFRWGRGDRFLTVHSGRRLGNNTNEGLVERVALSAGWQDIKDVHYQADRWLAEHQANPKPHPGNRGTAEKTGAGRRAPRLRGGENPAQHPPR